MIKLGVAFDALTLTTVLALVTLGAICVAALVVVLVVSCVTPLNVGVLAIAMAWIIGVYIGGLSANDVMGGFPTALFLTLAGVTLLFALAQSNGTLDKIAHYAVRACRGNRGLVAIMYFVMAAALVHDRAGKHRDRRPHGADGHEYGRSRRRAGVPDGHHGGKWRQRGLGCRRSRRPASS